MMNGRIWCILRDWPCKKMLMYLLYTPLFLHGQSHNLHSNPTVHRPCERAYLVYLERKCFQKNAHVLMYTPLFLETLSLNLHSNPTVHRSCGVWGKDPLKNCSCSNVHSGPSLSSRNLV